MSIIQGISTVVVAVVAMATAYTLCEFALRGIRAYRQRRRPRHIRLVDDYIRDRRA